MTTEFKECNNCGKSLPATEEFFYRRTKPNKYTYLVNICKSCEQERAGQWQKDNRQRATENVRVRRARKKAEVVPSSITITETQEAYVPAQKERERACRICEEVKPLTTEFFTFRRTRDKFETACKKCLNKRRVENRKKAVKKPEDPDKAASRRYRTQKTRKAWIARMSPSERAAYNEKRNEYERAYRQRKLEEYVEKHGSMPLCACGCGEQVGMNARGKPYKFAGETHHFRLYDAHELALNANEKMRENQNMIPIEKFRAGALQYKEELGLSWPKMATKGGWSKGQLNYYMFDKRVKSIGRQSGEDFFKRLKGIPCEPSTHMKRLFHEAERKRNVVISTQDRWMLEGSNV